MPPAFQSLESLTGRPHSLPSLSPADDLPDWPAAEAEQLSPEPAEHPLVSEALRRAEALERRAAALLAEAEAAAASRLAEAADRVEALVAQATLEADRLLEAARAEGFEQGKQAGHEVGAAEGMAQIQEDGAMVIEQAWQDADAITAEARAAAESLALKSKADRQQLLSQSENQVIELALAVARVILQREVTQDPRAILPAVRAALQKLKGEAEPVLRVAPAWVPFLTAQMGAIVGGLQGAPRLTVQGDPALAPGDWTVNGAGGWVDGRLEAQVRVAEDRIRREGP
ncbi:MAG TPA: FliH/SctL family protein [Symbiobacteriaceae bacterium]|nr:FliH/SctL family protein [Symbiobacteriaceae bacterium]